MNDRFLRNSLLGNAVFSTVSGLLFALGGGAVASFIGLDVATLVQGTGVGLLGFAAYVAFTATRAEVDLRAAWSIIIGDLAWVVGTVPIVALGLLSSNGNIAALLVADMVLLFAGLQYWGVRKLRRAMADAQPA